eukprot:3289702-Prymnesium_polylepis.2
MPPYGIIAFATLRVRARNRKVDGLYAQKRRAHSFPASRRGPRGRGAVAARERDDDSHTAQRSALTTI